MREQICEQCGNKYGLNDLVSVFDSTLCQSCGEKRLKDAEQDQITDQSVFSLSDPTICARCGADGGNQEFEFFVEMPICENCRDAMVNYRYPAWIKGFFAGILIITICSIAWNFRFFQARILMEQAIRIGFVQGNVDTATKKMSKAANLVPGAHGLQVLSHYLEGVQAIRDDDSQTALNHFQKCNELPESYQVEQYMLIAEFGVAFDNKEYQRFLELSIKYRDSFPDDPIPEAQIASAYACLYAEEKKQECKEKAMEHLQIAEEKATPDDQKRFEEYRERILYRLETRRILNSEEYYKETGKVLPEETQ
ncbi:MAG: hypothetical protein ABFR90_04860 [Planctomycetota bacterium]